MKTRQSRCMLFWKETGEDDSKAKSQSYKLKKKEIRKNKKKTRVKETYKQEDSRKRLQ